MGPQALFLQLRNVSNVDLVCVSSAYKNVKTKKVVRFFSAFRWIGQICQVLLVL